MVNLMYHILLLLLTIILVSCNDNSDISDISKTNKTTIYCGLLIDGISNQPLSNQLITIINGEITNIRQVTKPIVDINLEKFTCLPGLIDTHTHITENPDLADLSIHFKRTLEETMKIGSKNAALTINAGFTTIRNLGAYYGWAARELRDKINQGKILGPRIQAAGYYLTSPGGGGDLVIPGIPETAIPKHVRLGVTKGQKNFELKTEEAIKGGADVIKVIASGAVLAFGGIPGAPELSENEIRAIAKIAHANGVKVTAHAHGAKSIKDSILAGVDSIEHASLANNEVINLAVKYDVAFSMDIYNGTYIDTIGRKEKWPEEFLIKNNETTEAQRKIFTKAHRAGVPIIFGTDAGVYPHGDNAKQFSIMVERGMTNMEAIKSATSIAAKFIGWENLVGRIATGYYGDIIAVSGNPLEDISILENVDVVIKDGQRIK